MAAQEALGERTQALAAAVRALDSKSAARFEAGLSATAAVCVLAGAAAATAVVCALRSR